MVKLYLAGAENRQKMATLLQAKQEYWLMNFYYLDKAFASDASKRKLLDDLKDKGIKLFMDSGAFTFQMKDSAHPDYKDEAERTVKSYTQFLSKFGDYFDVYAEMDLDRSLGVAKVDEWYQDMKAKGLTPMRVWHGPRGMQGFKKMCAEEKYLAITWYEFSDQIPTMLKYLNYANSKGAKVHGFAATSAEFLKYSKFYSVDSSSWITGEKFGIFYLFEGNTLKNYPKNAFKEKYLKCFNKAKNKDMSLWNAVQWKKFADHLGGINYGIS